MNFAGRQTSRAWAIGIVAAVLTLGLLALWAATYHRNAWSVRMPAYVCVHGGNVCVLSTVWARASGGEFAWRSGDWMYDVSLGSWPVRWRPTYFRIGNSYGGTPLYRTVMHCVSVPLWMVAGVPGLVAWVTLRRAMRWRRPGCCAACGYDLAGTVGVCPECGRERAG